MIIGISKKIRSMAAVLMLSVITLTCTGAAEAIEVQASSKYITVEQFIKYLVDEMRLPLNGREDADYVSAAADAGLMKADTFKNIKSEILLQSAAMLLAKADEYCWGEAISDEDARFIMENRIIDINQVRKAWRPWFAKAYALGYFQGKSQEAYSTTRKFSPRKRLSKTTAEAMIGRLLDKDKRYQVSPDYQAIRTTKLPKLAEFYPYILDSYPNAYYDWEFNFMKGLNLDGTSWYDSTGKHLDKINDAYAAPANFDEYIKTNNLEYYFNEIYGRTKEKFKNDVLTYLNYAFNVDYRTVDKDEEWKDFMRGIMTEERLELYIKECKENETIIECDKVAADLSSMYQSTTSGIAIRTYVHFRILSDKNKGRSKYGICPLVCGNCDWDWLMSDYYTVGEWRDGFYDVTYVGPVHYGGFSSTRTIDETNISDYDYFVNQSSIFKNIK